MSPEVVQQKLESHQCEKEVEMIELRTSSDIA